MTERFRPGQVVNIPAVSNPVVARMRACASSACKDRPGLDTILQYFHPLKDILSADTCSSKIHMPTTTMRAAKYITQRLSTSHIVLLKQTNQASAAPVASQYINTCKSDHKCNCKAAEWRRLGPSSSPMGWPAQHPPPQCSAMILMQCISTACINKPEQRAIEARDLVWWGS
jgi:hypothetical protein